MTRVNIMNVTVLELKFWFGPPDIYKTSEVKKTIKQKHFNYSNQLIRIAPNHSKYHLKALQILNLILRCILKAF